MLPTSYATNQPYNIHVTKKFITATSKCSCGDGTWHYKTVTFYNYDPSSHRWGVLSYSKYADAGQWTSKITDVDYCMQCGKEKISGSDLHLTRYYGNITTSKPVVSKMEKTEKPKPTPVEVVKDKLHLNMLLN